MLFLSKQEIIYIHQQLINQFGGIHGLRDESALESALAAAENRAYYENAGLAACAATYAWHLSQAHAFLDGNKRIAAAAAEIFLEINGAKLNAENEQLVDLFLNIAAGMLSRTEVESWFIEHVSSY
ncbi:MAG: type II toxin-antitoxin system death-on-curing family toxin [Candidatus Electronema sp. V4]|uniref:type II toxin-antitoxin system death-on-curing family toxin n=1 Tax=Candidatus Electronema sp. V4 TaxID=3454756 RepID=UPI004055722F